MSSETEQDLVQAIESGEIANALPTPLSNVDADALIEASKADPGAPFAPETLVRLRATQVADLAGFMRLRGRLKKAGISVGTLDRAIGENAKRIDDADARAGRALELAAPEPWREPVDGGALLSDIVEQIRRYVMLSRDEAIAVALWIIHSHAFALFPITPRLLIESPTPRCGKTRLVEIIQRLVPRPLRADNISAASLFRVIEKSRPVTLIDEADSFLRESEDHRNIVNSGHSRGGAVVRLVGDDFEPRSFSTFAPVALASIGGLASTIMDRSIVVQMRRRLASERIERFRSDRAGHLDALARKAARWVADHEDALRDADPEMPEALHDRAADNWRPCLAIADLAGGDWAREARDAALALAGHSNDTDEQSKSVMLLDDLRRIFDGGYDDLLCGSFAIGAELAALRVKGRPGFERLPSEALAKALAALTDRPWATWARGQPIKPRAVANLLKPFGIAPNTIKLSDGKQPNGYRRAQCDDAFARYLSTPDNSPAQSSPCSPIPTNPGVCGQNPSSPRGMGGELQNHAQPHRKYGFGEHGELQTANFPRAGKDEHSERSLAPTIGGTPHADNGRGGGMSIAERRRLKIPSGMAAEAARECE